MIAEPTHVFRQLAFERIVRREVPRDQVRRTGPDTISIDGAFGRFAHTHVVGKTEIIVAAKVQQFTP